MFIFGHPLLSIRNQEIYEVLSIFKIELIFDTVERVLIFITQSKKGKMEANRKLLDELMGADRDGVQRSREVTVY